MRLKKNQMEALSAACVSTSGLVRFGDKWTPPHDDGGVYKHADIQELVDRALLVIYAARSERPYAMVTDIGREKVEDYKQHPEPLRTARSLSDVKWNAKKNLKTAMRKLELAEDKLYELADWVLRERIETARLAINDVMEEIDGIDLKKLHY